MEDPKPSNEQAVVDSDQQTLRKFAKKIFGKGERLSSRVEGDI
jgi:hypothetical protein